MNAARVSGENASGIKLNTAVEIAAPIPGARGLVPGLMRSVSAPAPRKVAAAMSNTAEGTRTKLPSIPATNMRSAESPAPSRIPRQSIAAEVDRCESNVVDVGIGGDACEINATGHSNARCSRRAPRELCPDTPRSAAGMSIPSLAVHRAASAASTPRGYSKPSLSLLA